MKILIDARELRTSTGRYIERLLFYLQEVDEKNKYLVLLKPKDMDGWIPRSKRFKKVSCSYKEFTFTEQWGLLWQIIRLKPDIVHFGMVQQPILYFGKIVTTMHDLTTLRFTNPSKKKLVFKSKQVVYKYVNKIVARKSHTIITPTQYVKDDIAKFARINSRKIRVTYEAADPIDSSPVAYEDLVDQKFIMYTGRPSAHKNLARLIDSFEILRQEFPELRLVLVGKTDILYKRLARKVEKRKLKNIIFCGYVDEGSLRWLYENAAAYVFPSLSEGFGLPGLEAMVHGCPVVSSNATCLPEVYGDAAHYFDPEDTQEMAEKISNVLESEKLRKKLVEKGYEQAKKYSWKRMAEQTLSVYNDVLE